MACHAMRKLHIKYPTSGSHFFVAKESDKEEFNGIVFTSCHTEVNVITSIMF